MATLEGHLKSVRALAVDDEFLYSGGPHDNTVRVWLKVDQREVDTSVKIGPQGSLDLYRSVLADDVYIYQTARDCVLGYPVFQWAKTIAHDAITLTEGLTQPRPTNIEDLASFRQALWWLGICAVAVRDHEQFATAMSVYELCRQAAEESDIEVPPTDFVLLERLRNVAIEGCGIVTPVADMARGGTTGGEAAIAFLEEIIGQDKGLREMAVGGEARNAIYGYAYLIDRLKANEEILRRHAPREYDRVLQLLQEQRITAICTAETDRIMALDTETEGMLDGRLDAATVKARLARVEEIEREGRSCGERALRIAQEHALLTMEVVVEEALTTLTETVNRVRRTLGNPNQLRHFIVGELEAIRNELARLKWSEDSQPLRVLREVLDRCNEVRESALTLPALGRQCDVLTEEVQTRIRLLEQVIRLKDEVEGLSLPGSGDDEAYHSTIARLNSLIEQCDSILNDGAQYPEVEGSARTVRDELVQKRH
ncbi:MAG: WD40 repeat domain-containing protein, partial [Candidatus Thorarchaeota archaeon]